MYSSWEGWVMNWKINKLKVGGDSGHSFAKPTTAACEKKRSEILRNRRPADQNRTKSEAVVWVHQLFVSSDPIRTQGPFRYWCGPNPPLSKRAWRWGAKNFPRALVLSPRHIQPTKYRLIISSSLMAQESCYSVVYSTIYFSLEVEWHLSTAIRAY